MQNLTAVGRILFAIAMVAFGIEHFLYASVGAGLGPPWTPEIHVLDYVIGVLLVAGGVCLGIGRQVRLAAMVLAVVFFARGALYYLPKVAAAPHQPRPWTSAFELLAMCGASLVLAATFTSHRPYSGRADAPSGIMFQSGRFLFAASLVVFGIQHFLYADFIATLITPWIPGHLFWAYFVGVAFLAAALAIGSGKLASLASALLGTMFFLWVVVLHALRVAGALRNGNEWTSLLVAVAMSGCAFVIAGAFAGTQA